MPYLGYDPLMNGIDIEIRHGRTADVFAIGRILVETWRVAFRGLLADDFLDRMSPAEQAVRHMGRRSAPGVQYYVAVDRRTGEVVGFVNFGGSRAKAPVHVSEIYALYVRPAYQGFGIGGRIVRAAARRVASGGAHSLFAWVLSTNPNRAFYEHLGAVIAQTGRIGIGGRSYEQVSYVWHDLEALLADGAGAV